MFEYVVGTVLKKKIKKKTMYFIIVSNCVTHVPRVCLNNNNNVYLLLLCYLPSSLFCLRLLLNSTRMECDELIC